MDNLREILVLMCSTEGWTHATALPWMLMDRVYTRKHAHLLYMVVDTEGPAEDVICEILQILQDVFMYVVEDKWSYEKCLEFYHAFPFKELMRKEEVVPFW